MHHPYIQAVIDSILFRDGKVFVTLSAGEQSPMGKILHHLYYNSNVLELLGHGERYGYPHNGGRHTLNLMCKPADAITMLGLIVDAAVKQGSQHRSDEQMEILNQFWCIHAAIVRKCPYKM